MRPFAARGSGLPSAWWVMSLAAALRADHSGSALPSHPARRLPQKLLRFAYRSPGQNCRGRSPTPHSPKTRELPPRRQSLQQRVVGPPCPLQSALVPARSTAASRRKTAAYHRFQRRPCSPTPQRAEDQGRGKLARGRLGPTPQAPAQARRGRNPQRPKPPMRQVRNESSPSSCTDSYPGTRRRRSFYPQAARGRGLPSRSCARCHGPPSPFGLRRDSLLCAPRREGWWAVRGSNPRPSRCKRDALPLS